MQSEKKLGVALTLVELLVTISIIGLVIAISVPMIKPMLATNKVKNGADIVAGFLAQARNRAIEEGRPVGVTFERVLNYEDGGAYPYNGASVLMRQVAEPKPLSGFVRDVRVATDSVKDINGRIIYCRVIPCAWNTSTGIWDPSLGASETLYWDKLIQTTGDQIQFDAKGPKYEITKQAANDFRIVMNTDANRNLAPPVYSDQQPALFKVFRKPQPGKVAPTMAPPVAMPEGIVVDLDCSGMGEVIYDHFGALMDTNDPLSQSPVVRDAFSANGQGDQKSVTIMFSPTGEVDKVYYSVQNQGGNNNLIESRIPNGPIFLNIGTWELSGFWMEDASGRWRISNDYLPDAGPGNGLLAGYTIGTRNYIDMNNYWVTVFPRTGAVRVNRVAQPITQPSRANVLSSIENGTRKFANSMHTTETR